MKKRLSLLQRYYRWRARWGRVQRLLFPSPAELKLIELMGGHVLRIGWLKHTNTRFPFAIVLSRGKLFRQEKMKREVRIGPFYADFANDVYRVIEVDGTHWHMDVVAEFEREAYLYQNGWQLLRIKAPRIWNDSAGVQREVLQYLTK